MQQQLLRLAQQIFHQLLPKQRRDRLYKAAPAPLQQVWDRLLPQPLTKKRVRSALRLFWLREPSQNEIDEWYDYAQQPHVTLPMLVHELMYHPQSAAADQPLRGRTADFEAAAHAYRLLLLREPSPVEQLRCQWRVHVERLTYEQVVQLMQQHPEYQQRQHAEQQPHLVELDRFKLYIRRGDYFTSAPIERFRMYEPDTGRVFAERVRPGDTVLDIGANVGYHTMHLATLVGSGGRVIAFEPHPGNVELIKLSVAANQFEQVTVNPYAVGMQEATLELLAEGNHTNSRLFTNPDHDSKVARRFSVRTVALDDYLRDLDRLDFVKIDVEGAELLAVYGMRQLLQRFRPPILFELFPGFLRITSQAEPEALLALLAQVGYRFCVVGEHGVQAMSSIKQLLQLQQQSGQSHIDVLAVAD